MEKTIYFIRHGESTFNEWRTRSLWTFSWIFVKDPMIFDAPLSSKGHLQVEQLKEAIKDKQLNEVIQLIICSPLTRAIQTALGGFDGCNIPFKIHPSCREMLDTACDIGRDPSELSADFPTLDFSELNKLWYVPSRVAQGDKAFDKPDEIRETIQDVDVRIKELLAFLNDRPEHEIAVVCHSSFIKRATKATRKLKNCEIFSISFKDLCQLHSK
ncbi:phosphoglycerate mutase family protein [Thraustotheca clavata]|uniref:Phosphoglycerate mutase family protein n=1 Tax=Thraustotheca clavata TaxID=74557 RepID=A0A1W0A5F5_9STRA|nr:phosphoglycerate mutase family protein [Thraustotheca clavata]